LSLDVLVVSCAQSDDLWLHSLCGQGMYGGCIPIVISKADFGLRPPTDKRMESTNAIFSRRN